MTRTCPNCGRTHRNLDPRQRSETAHYDGPGIGGAYWTCVCGTTFVAPIEHLKDAREVL